MSSCVFCKKIKDEDYDYVMNDVVSFIPLNPVVPGHRLFVPVEHVKDALDDPEVTARTMKVASAMTKEKSCNIITSVGSDATQTVFHLHIHIVPRQYGDGLTLPWTGQRKD